MRFFVFVGTVQLILFLGHWVYYRTLVHFLGLTGSPRLHVLRFVTALLSVSFVPASFLAFRYSNILVRILYTSAATWVGVLYLLILASFLCWLFYGCSRLFHFHINRHLLVGILTGIALLASLYGVINSCFTRITRLNVHVEGLPAPWKGKTAVWVSDTHLGQVRNLAFARSIASLVQSLNPDIVLIGGDLFDGVAAEPDTLLEPFSRLSPRYGTFFVAGNHEEFSDSGLFVDAVRRSGIRVLQNEKVEIEGLQIVGVDYRDSRSEDSFRTILRKLSIDRKRPTILLKHAPFHLQVAEEHGISLQLSGHTHHGQVFLFRFITQRVYRGYDYGLKRHGRLIVNTSSGAGTWGPPMRLDTKPEIVAITFE
jgi:predicted MPP superfamily phosphohydrolase